jgi:uncharacterized membrane protein YfhO
MSAQHLTIDSFNDNRLTGNINLTERKIMFLPIPYNDGWRLIIDGKEAKILRINLDFIGVMLEAGSHSVELNFVPPGSTLGNAITLAALGLLLAYLAFCGIKKRKAQL